MKMHHKKLTQPYFDDVWSGDKRFELRKNDCDYEVNDLIILEEYDSISNTYSGRKIRAHIVYVLKDYDGLEEGYCILGLLF